MLMAGWLFFRVVFEFHSGRSYAFINRFHACIVVCGFWVRCGHG